MMKTKTNRLFAAEDDGCRNAESGKYRFVILDPRPKLVAPFSGRFYQCQGTGDWAKLFARTAGDTAWISTNAKKTDALLRAATAYLSSHTGRRTLGDLMLLSSPRPESLPALHAVFRNVVGEVASYRFLPPEELVDVLSSPRE